MKSLNETEQLKERIRQLEEELKLLKEKNGSDQWSPNGPTVIVPEDFKPIFDTAEKNVQDYFSKWSFEIEKAQILINGERYVLLRSAALSIEFLDAMKEFYSNRPEEEAIRIGNNFLFDISHVLGKEDALAFHKKMNLQDPIQKLSAGPVHFAFTGWANVEIFPESVPTPDEHFFLKFYHHNSFEAESWIKAGRQSKIPVCTMNCGYSSGWCEESFGISLTAVEIECRAAGADHCTFIMAPPDKIHEHLERESNYSNQKTYDVPVFFERKYNEEQLKKSLLQKETLLREVHHRVKNNLQIMSSLLRLQRNKIKDSEARREFDSSVNRIQTMAQIHEMIYGDPNISAIHIEKYFTGLISSIQEAYGSVDDSIEIVKEIQLTEVNFHPDKAIPLGILLNEIMCNSYKHAFDDKKGIIRLQLLEKEGKYQLTIGDNGKGMPESVDEDSLGLSLIPILCEQIDADLSIENSTKGLVYHIRF